MRAELQQLVQSFNEKLELDIPTGIAEEEILLKLEERLGQLLQRNPEEFFRILYIVDIPEYQLNNACNEMRLICSTLSESVRLNSGPNGGVVSPRLMGDTRSLEPEAATRPRT